MTTQSLVLFQVAEQRLALPAEAVIQILPLPRLACPPGLPPALAGFLNFGGAPVGVLRMELLLGMAPQKAELYSHLLHLRLDYPGLALLVPRVLGVVSVAADEMRVLSDDDTFRGAIVAEIEHQGLPVHVLAIDRLLAQHERTRIEAYRAAEAERRRAFEAAS